MRHLHLDPLGGLAGDMFLAALADAFPEHVEGTVAAMRAAGLPDVWQVRFLAEGDGTLTGARLVIEPSEDGPGPPSGSWREIRGRLQRAPLEQAVRDRAIAIFTLLAEAEAAVHGVAVGAVHFHELADWDSIADIVGAAFMIEALGPASWSSAPLPLGGGRVRTRHGPLPVPAPATARLLEGLGVIDDGIAGERVTPTGAAIFRHLEPASGLPPGHWRLATSGTGFGTRRLEGISNALRVLVHDQAVEDRSGERVAVIAFEVDDQSPEDLAVALDELRGTEGVLDVIQLPAFGKKGRICAQIQLLARPERLDAVIERCFVETSTIGLRHRIEARAVLERTTRRVAGAGGEMAVKVVRRPDGRRTAKAEIEDVRRGPAGAEGRIRARRAAEQLALEEDDDGPDEPTGS